MDDERIFREFKRLSVNGFDDLQNYDRTSIPPQARNKHYTPRSDETFSDDEKIDNKNRPSHTFDSIQKNLDNDNDIKEPLLNGNSDTDHKHKYDKYDIYVYDEKDDQYIEDIDDEPPDNNNGQISIDDIINDLKRRKENRLKSKHNRLRKKSSISTSTASTTSPRINSSLYLSPSPPMNNNTNNSKHSRFMLATWTNHHLPLSPPLHHQLSAYNNHHKHNARDNSPEVVDKYKTMINDKDNEIKALKKELQEKDELIKSLQYRLLQSKENTPSTMYANMDLTDDSDNESNQMLAPPKFSRHQRQKSMTQAHTEQSTIENVRWELRSEISKVATAQNEVNRLLQSVGDTSMLHGRLKKLSNTLSNHQRKVSALEQTLNINEFDGNMIFTPDLGDNDLDEEKLRDIFSNGFHEIDDEKKDFEIISSEYSKLKLQIAQYQQEENQWNNTKKELDAVNKRCNNLMNMLDKLSDEKLQLTLQIEDLQALLSQHSIKFTQ